MAVCGLHACAGEVGGRSGLGGGRGAWWGEVRFGDVVGSVRKWIKALDKSSEVGFCDFHDERQMEERNEVAIYLKLFAGILYLWSLEITS